MARSQEMKSQLSNLYVHGVADAVASSTIFGRVVWGLFIFSALTAVTYYVYRNVEEFLHSPILTSSSIEIQSALEFPDIYLCPSQPLDSEQLYPLETHQLDFVYEKMAKSFLSSGQGEDAESLLGQAAKVWDKTDQLGPGPRTVFKSYSSPLNTLPEIFKALSFPTRDFLRECAFGQRKLSCSEISRRLFDKNNGLCYLIRVDSAQSVEGAGLQMVLDINRNRYPFKPLLEGITVGIFQRFDPTASSATQLQISPGGKTKVTLDLTRLKLINFQSLSTKQECKEGPETLQNFETLQNVSYTVSACRTDCIEKVTFRECSCSLPLDPIYLKRNYNKLCDPEEIQDCFYALVMKTPKLEAEMNKCIAEKCIVPCDSWQFATSTSFMPFSNDSWEVVPPGKEGEHRKISDAKGNHSEDSIETKQSSKLSERPKEDLILLDIAFGKIQLIKVSQSPAITVDTCISNLGGQLGLWLGASILTIIQIVSVFITFVASFRTNPGEDARDDEVVKTDEATVKNNVTSEQHSVDRLSMEKP